VGLTQSAGYEIGARRIMPLTLPAAWDLITSKEGLRAWLGEVRGWTAAQGGVEAGHHYQTRDGAEGEVRVVNPRENLRLTWRPKDWPAPSAIQVRVIPSGRKTVISFHQEHLPGAETREQMRARWQKALDDLEALVTQRTAKGGAAR
jgi:uncharacterized protein YndB with AHSA1/START domain